MADVLKSWHRPVWLLIVCGCAITVISFGARAGFGLFLEPISSEYGWGREVFALSLAIQNLLWGMASPIAGAVADKYGSGRVLAGGAVLYAGGVALMAYSSQPILMHLTAGGMIGFGIAAASFAIVFAAFGRSVTPEKRSLALGIGTASGSLGQFVLVPMGQAFITAYGWHTALLLIAAVVLLIVPLAAAVTGKGDDAGDGDDQTIREALVEALRHRSYVLLVFGFFVCGFHVGFIQVHLPAYITDQNLPAYVGANALALVGLFNVGGSFLSGYLGGRFSKRITLSGIYLLRALAIALFVLFPISEWSVYIFSAAIGVLWLSTVPLTSGLVAQFFGVRYMATLFGFVFFSHQIGAFLGVWLGGWLYDVTKSYQDVWWIAVGLGVFAGLVHLPISERPVARLAAQQA
jgi:MFS family permease